MEHVIPRWIQACLGFRRGVPMDGWCGVGSMVTHIPSAISCWSSDISLYQLERIWNKFLYAAALCSLARHVASTSRFSIYVCAAREARVTTEMALYVWSILVTCMHLFLCFLCNRFDLDRRKIEAFVGSKIVIQVYKYMLCFTLNLCISLLFTFLSSDKICLVVWLVYPDP